MHLPGIMHGMHSASCEPEWQLSASMGCNTLCFSDGKTAVSPLLRRKTQDEMRVATVPYKSAYGRATNRAPTVHRSKCLKSQLSAD